MYIKRENAGCWTRIIRICLCLLLVFGTGHIWKAPALAVGRTISAGDHAGPRQQILSWSDDPKTSQSVIWTVDTKPGAAAPEQYIQYVKQDRYHNERSFQTAAQEKAEFRAVGSVGGERWCYTADLTGLSPGTSYCYRTGNSSDWNEVKTFRTAPDQAGEFSFLYLGDVQVRQSTDIDFPAWGKLLRDAWRWNPHLAFGLMGGDMVQSGRNLNEWSCFLSYASPVFSMIPMMTTIGNHESNFPGGKAQHYLDILSLPKNGPSGFAEEMYSFHYGGVHFIVLNSWALSSEQNLSDQQKHSIRTWIEEDLEEAKEAKFRIALLHHPAYPVTNDNVSAVVQKEWAPLLEDGGVDLALVGHQHVYSRSKPLKAGQVNVSDGITWVMGNAGLKYYQTADDGMLEKLIFNTPTYQIINVTEHTLSLKTCNGNGTVLDTWTKGRRSGNNGDVNGG